MILCDSGLRPPHERGPGGLVRLASASGCQGLAAGHGCLLPELPALAAEAGGVALSLVVLRGPMAEQLPGPGRRVPHLAAVSDREERAAAVALTTRLIEAAASFGARLVTLHLGDVALRVAATEVTRAFARRALGEVEGSEQLAAAIAERRSLSPSLLDAGRWALERLVVQAERHGLTLAIELSATPWQAGSPREVLALMDEFRGAPVGLVLDAAKLDALAALGLGVPAERRAALAAAARVLDLDDTVGIETGFLPGLGDPPSPIDEVALGTPRVVCGRTDSTEGELAAAVATARAARGAGAPGPVA